MVVRQRYGPYNFGGTTRLTNLQMRELTDRLQSPPASARGVLGGRVGVDVLSLDKLGSVVIKHYRRGGLLGHCVKKTYLRTGPPRSCLEFEILAALHGQGLPVPEPLLFVYKGNLLYQAWLVTAEIPKTETLESIGRRDVDRLTQLMPQVVTQVERLINCEILHVDLHPGNVLVDDRDRIFIVDFDKAQSGRQDKAALCRHYITRWRRAVRKHELPPLLATMFTLGSFY